MQKSDFDRFITRYDEYYARVEKELAGGRKESHWMWFIFPQIKGLGNSKLSMFYAIQNIDEAKAFLNSSCGGRMSKLLEILLGLEENNPEKIFGCIDARKMKSSMTLFSEADSSNPLFSQILEKFYNGEKDEKTLAVLDMQQNESENTACQNIQEKVASASERGDIGALRMLRRDVFKETITIAQRGVYTAGDTYVFLPDSSQMMKNSKMYCQVEKVNLPENSIRTVVEVCDCDSLLAGKRLLEEGYHPAVLNFANRQSPGGGVLNGAGAQEENIFRRSNLFLSLYQFHSIGMKFDVPRRNESYPMDRNTGGAYSPDVTVFRGSEQEGYSLLQNPYQLGIVTVAAMNSPELKNPYQIADHLVEPVCEKIRTVFRIALNHGHDSIVLGAWGCGAFTNPPQHIAKLFHQVMDEKEFCNKFKKIVFAIMERKNVDNGNLLPFLEEFAVAGTGSVFQKQENKKELFNRFKGMFWGLVIGDCLGSPIQFMDKDDHPYITEMKPCRHFNTPPGYWTDDSSMAFCVADSLIRLKKYDLPDIANNFVRWYKDGFYSSLPYAFDVGGATCQAIGSIACGFLRNGEECSQGNGSIMRFAPSYIWNYGNSNRKILHEISDLTHCSRKIRETVDLMADICDEHLSGERTAVKSFYKTREEVNNSGWAVSTLQAALWAFETTETFEEGMIAAVNLGGDADSIGAVYGQIAGAFYGFDAIPERWLAAVKDRAQINELIENLIFLKDSNC